jgi:glycosyltransferase involved in cell wall biosynthesis
MTTESLRVHSLLLVRNSVDHDARVLRAARVAAQTFDGAALVVGVATGKTKSGATILEGVPVLRLPPFTRGFTRLAIGLQRISPKRISGARTAQAATRLEGIALSPKQIDVEVLGQSATSKGRSHPRSRRLTLTARARRILVGLSFLRQALSVARQTRPKLVHANDWNTMWSGLAIKLMCGSRLVYDSHELWTDRNGRWEYRPWLLAGEALFVRAADEVVTSSTGYADLLAARYRIPRPTVVRNIPEHHFGPDAQSRKARTPPPQGGRSRVSSSATSDPISPPRIVYVGGLMPGRGLEQIIDALVYLPGVQLCAIGPGAPQYNASLARRAQEAGVESRVELRAPVAPEDIPSVLVGAAAGVCLIQPICRSYELSLPNKLFEYAAAGIPVLASDVPVIATIVRNEGLGEVVPAGDPYAIAAGLKRLLESDGWRISAQRTRDFAESNNWRQEANTLRDVYKRAGVDIAPSASATKR